MNIRIILSRIAAFGLAASALIVNAPPELQAQVFQCIPAQFHEWLTLGFLASAYIVHTYGSRQAVQDAVSKALRKSIPLLLAGLLLGFSGCSGPLVGDFKSKSTNMGVSGIGGTFASVDPATGSTAPSIKLGMIDTRIMNHRPGDGTQVSITTNKSFWSREIGSQNIQINGKSALSGTFTYAPGGAVSISFSEQNAAQ